LRNGRRNLEKCLGRQWTGECEEKGAGKPGEKRIIPVNGESLCVTEKVINLELVRDERDGTLLYPQFII